jgi:hypothetical protein
MESKTCQNCKQDFTIYDRDASFYEKINVPKPTFCPDCRIVRRMMWRNVRSLFRRECGLCHATIISMYKDDGAPVYCTSCWNSDAWDQYATGRSYDFSKSFFEQLQALFSIAPRYYQYRSGNLVNSDFANFIVDGKNVYLSYSVVSNEDIAYCDTVDKSKNTLDSFASQKLDTCSWNIDSEGNYNSHYVVKSQTCIDSYLLFDCVNCQNCCLSYNLRNQQYVFKNQKLSKEEYSKAIAGLKLDTNTGLEMAKKEFKKEIRENAIHRFAQIYNSQNSTGDFIGGSKDIFYSFDVHESENVAYSVRAPMNVKDSYDVQGTGVNAELIYESLAASINTYKDFFCYITLTCKECEYSLILKNCSNCFGCVGLTNATYCIFNKQYSKEEYFEIVAKIKQHMEDMPYRDTHGRVFSYGEFFPYAMCPFGYNETNAHDNFTLSKESVNTLGYPWYEREKRDYAITIESELLPDSITDTSESICQENIGCPNKGNSDTQCTVAYRITPDEFQFYKAKHLPVPRLCPNCRHYERLTYRNKMKLYDRACSNSCGVIFKTTYDPNGLEKVYCESCYQKSVL